MTTDPTTWEEAARYVADTLPYWWDGVAVPLATLRRLYDVSDTRDRPCWGDMAGVALCGVKNLDPNYAKKVVVETIIGKQRDYGHDNINRFGRQGLLVRYHDKLARLENLLSKGREPSNESVQDTWLDLVGYAIIGEMWERSWFLLPLEEDLPKTITDGETIRQGDQWIEIPAGGSCIDSTWIREIVADEIQKLRVLERDSLQPTPTPVSRPAWGNDPLAEGI